MDSLLRRLAIAAILTLSAFAGHASAEWTEGPPDEELGFALGSPDAPLTVIEYFSPTCSHCKHFEEDIMPSVEENYIATGKVRFVMREYLRNDLDTAILSQARCLAPDKGLAYLRDVFTRQEDMFAAAKKGETSTLLVEIGTSYGIATKADFDRCFKDMNIRFDMMTVQESADHYDVQSTPTLVIGNLVKPGDQDILTPEAFAAFLDAQLAAKAPADPS